MTGGVKEPEVSYLLFNLDFLLNLSLPLRVANWRPDHTVRSLADVVQTVERHAIRGVIFDLDQVLTPYGSEKVSEGTVAAVGLLAEMGSCCILSNSHSPRGRGRAIAVARQLCIRVVESPKKKPSPRAFRDALAVLQTSPEETLMVGDRVLTDIVGANAAGIRTALIFPLNWRSDPFFMITVPRVAERLVLMCIKSLTMMGNRDE